MIYILLKGRIGNQLFMYATARAYQKSDEQIIIDDTEVLKMGWVNSLTEYNLNNVVYVHSHKHLLKYGYIFRGFILKVYHHFTRIQDYWKKYNRELKMKNLNEKIGIFLFENGYVNFHRKTKNVLMDGYFQSPKYFDGIRKDILSDLSVSMSKISDYPGIDILTKRNSICISIKVEHNVGSSIYDVCNDGYWKSAINYIIENVDNPVFFICSDNVEYVKKNLIDTTKYECVCQDASYTVNESLAVMSLCKHFIIGNTTFGWWAQYMSSNNDKIVVAPSKWMKIDMPIDIYQDNWKIINV